MPIDYKKYAPNWLDEIRPRILLRANYKCEQCGRKHKKHYLKNDLHNIGELDDTDINLMLRTGCAIVRIILTIAHLDRNPMNNANTNLRALCQHCHLNYDREDNIFKRKTNKAHATGR